MLIWQIFLSAHVTYKSSPLINGSAKSNRSFQWISQWVLLFLDVLVWVFVSTSEANISILTMHSLFLTIALIIVYSVGLHAALPFAIGLLLRSVFAVLAWYTADNFDRQFYIGTNSDASRFWDAAQLDYAQASLAFEDPLFPRLNVLVTQLSEVIGSSAYMATTQSVLLAGSMTIVFAYLFMRQHYGERVASFTAYIMAVSPVAITYSTGLMRDALIGLFGLVMLWALSRIKDSRQKYELPKMLLVTILSLLALAYLRSTSMAAFVLAGFIVLMSGTPERPDRMTFATRIVVLGTLAFLILFAMIDRIDRFQNIFEYAETVRAGTGVADGMQLNPEGITTRIGEISPFLFALISPSVLIQPFPFFAWDAPYYEPGPPAFMDIVQGFGGLFNQILFGFYILGAYQCAVKRDNLGWRLGVLFTLLVCTLSLIGLGQIRMVMAICYIFFYGVIANYIVCNKTKQVIRCFVSWLFCLLAFYVIYILYRHGFGYAFMIPMSFILACSFVFFFRKNNYKC